MIQYDKRKVAVEFLDAAVCEHLDHGRYFAAYNLAAVAEELLSKFLRLATKKDRTEIKIGMVQAINRVLGHPDGEHSAWRKRFFELRNTIKHMDSGIDRYFEANIEKNAQQKIAGAVACPNDLGLNPSPDVRRFDEYRMHRKR